MEACLINGWLWRRHWETDWAHMEACLKKSWLLGRYLARYRETHLAHMESCLILDEGLMEDWLRQKDNEGGLLDGGLAETDRQSTWLQGKQTARHWKTDWAHMEACLMEGWLLGWPESKHLARHWETSLAHMEACFEGGLAAGKILGKVLGDWLGSHGGLLEGGAGC